LVETVPVVGFGFVGEAGYVFDADAVEGFSGFGGLVVYVLDEGVYAD